MLSLLNFYQVHALAFKFHSMGLDYIPRDQNTIADSLAKDASGNMVALTEQGFKFYFKLEKVMQNIKLPNQKPW